MGARDVRPWGAVLRHASPPAGMGLPAHGWEGLPSPVLSLAAAPPPGSDVPWPGLHPDGAPRSDFSRSPAERPRIGRRGRWSATASQGTLPGKTPGLGAMAASWSP